METLYRIATHNALGSLVLTGNVLDLGGTKDSVYAKKIQGVFTVTTVNLDEKVHPDIFHDLEKPLPLPNEKYDAVLIINVLEHIYGTRDLLAESKRVLKTGGKVVIAVPFLYPVHPSPHDYWRFTNETLAKLLADVGYINVSVTPLGTGVCAARMVLIERLLSGKLTALRAILHPISHFADAFLVTLARVTGKKFQPEQYPLGYMVVAEK